MKRSEQDIRFQWDLTKIFPDEAAWEAAMQQAEAAIPGEDAMHDHVAELHMPPETEVLHHHHRHHEHDRGVRARRLPDTPVRILPDIIEDDHQTSHHKAGHHEE